MSKCKVKEDRGSSVYSSRFMFPYDPGPEKRGPSFQQAASVFSVQTRLKAQIFEVILPTPVNTANADRTPPSTCFAAHHRQPAARPCPSPGSTRSELPRSVVDLCDPGANATRHDTTRREAD